jgi:hypothetical protein
VRCWPLVGGRLGSPRLYLVLLAAIGTVLATPSVAGATTRVSLAGAASSKPAPGAEPTVSTTTKFGYTGGAQTLELPAGNPTVEVTVTAGSGGNGNRGARGGGGTGGEGTRITARIPIPSGVTKLAMLVGGNGENGAFLRSGDGGWNGGGSAASATGGAGAGGASEVRAADAGGTRLIVAGGGGGGGAGGSEGLGGRGGYKPFPNGGDGASDKYNPLSCHGRGGGAASVNAGGGGGNSPCAGNGAGGGDLNGGKGGVSYTDSGGGGGGGGLGSGAGGGAGSTFVVAGATTHQIATGTTSSIEITYQAPAPRPARSLKCDRRIANSYVGQILINKLVCTADLDPSWRVVLICLDRIKGGGTICGPDSTFPTGITQKREGDNIVINGKLTGTGQYQLMPRVYKPGDTAPDPRWQDLFTYFDVVPPPPVFCVQKIEAKVGETFNDKHVCTANIDPKWRIFVFCHDLNKGKGQPCDPKATSPEPGHTSLPFGITEKTIPPPNPQLVLNGKLTQPGHYLLTFTVRDKSGTLFPDPSVKDQSVPFDVTGHAAHEHHTTTTSAEGSTTTTTGEPTTTTGPPEPTTGAPTT